MRASRKANVEFGLRRPGPPQNFYATVTAPVGTEWKRLEVEGVIGAPGNTYFLLIQREPGVTLWVDDASLDLLRPGAARPARQ